MKNLHLTLHNRKKIQEGLEKELSRTETSKIIKKDISTVAKEIKNRKINFFCLFAMLNFSFL